MRPVEINLHKRSATLELRYADGEAAVLDAEYLRVFSPSAEVQGHHPSQATLQTGKKWVKIDAIEAVGNYAIQLIFSDGHSSGIYSWELLRQLHQDRTKNWQSYLDQLSAAGKLRDPNEQTIAIFDPKTQ